MNHHPRTLILGLLLALSGPASAQTMLDTTTSIGVQNTLNSVGTPGMPALNLPTTGGGTVGAVPATGAASVDSAATAPKPAVVVTPLTAPQREALNNAHAAFRDGKYAVARDAFEALTRQNYTNPEPHFGLALALFALNNDRGADFELRQFMALAPGSFEGPYNLGVLAARSGNHDEALRLFTQAAGLMGAQASPTAARQVLESLAAEQTRKKDYAALSATLARITALDPADTSAAYRLAQARALAGQGTAALPDLYALVAHDPANPAVPILLADIYATQGLNDRALRELASALPRMKSGTDRATLLLRRARLLTGTGDTKNAVLAAQDATREDSRSAEAFTLLGDLRAARGDRPGAVNAYLNAVKLAPKDPAPRLALGTVRLALGSLAAARNDAALVLRLNPEAALLARAEALQGVAAYRLGDYAAARAALKSSALRAPNADTSLWLGLSAYALGDYGAAVNALSESVKLNPTVTARQNLASALLAVSRYAEAEAILRGLVSDDTRNAEAWYLLGLAQRSQGRDADARQAFKTAANLGHTKARGAL